MLHVWMAGRRSMCEGYDEMGTMSTIFAGFFLGSGFAEEGEWPDGGIEGCMCA